jgi:hypothetical protein
MANAGRLGIRAWEGDRCPSFEEYLEALFSTNMRDRLATGCPMTASASESARQGRAVSDAVRQEPKQDELVQELRKAAE